MKIDKILREDEYWRLVSSKYNEPANVNDKNKMKQLLNEN